MTSTFRARLVAGHTSENFGHRSKQYDAGRRRAKRLMCDPCKHGQHCLCKDEACPCVCNDSDFRWSRKAKPKNEIDRLTSDSELAQVLAVRPELRPLFFT